MGCSVSWTECRGDNRSVGWFQGFFQSAFHPGWTPKLPQNRQIACGSAAFGDGRGDGKRAVATPLFDGNCRPGALRVPLGFALLQGRHRPFPVPHRPTGITMSGSYTRNYTKTRFNGGLLCHPSGPTHRSSNRNPKSTSSKSTSRSILRRLRSSEVMRNSSTLSRVTSFDKR
jgi:hypothetical protein